MKVAIIDYGMGNVASVQKALDYLNVSNKVTNNVQEIKSAQAIILPGVGSFRRGIENLNQLKLSEVLTNEVIGNKKPFLGICLGMQLIARTGHEPVKTDGLNWIPGEVMKISDMGKRIPHMGWNNISVVKGKYLKNLNNQDFYFTHSYHFQVADETVITSTVDYGIKMVSSIEKDNIFATQFHPEKSQIAGLTALKQFFSIHA